MSERFSPPFPPPHSCLPFCLPALSVSPALLPHLLTFPLTLTERSSAAECRLARAPAVATDGRVAGRQEGGRPSLAQSLSGCWCAYTSRMMGVFVTRFHDYRQTQS